MDDFVNTVNRSWAQTDPVFLATYVLWRINNIHPFINGNGRTARAACYFTLCVAVGGSLSGTKILPELIRDNRQEYCDALQAAHDSFANGTLDLAILHALVSRLLDEQMKSAPATIGGTPIVWPPKPSDGTINGAPTGQAPVPPASDNVSPS
jgi:Fic family protein